MDYLKPFTFFAGATGGFGNLLLCAVCNLIPVVGPIVLMGYRAEVADELVRDRRLRRHPAFDFNRFGDYLARGVWPWVYQLLLVVAAGVVVVAGVVAVGLAVGAVGPPDDPAVLVGGVLAGYLVVGGGLTVSAALVLWPMELHAQLSQRFAPVEAFGFAYRFQRRVWGQTLVALAVFLLGSSLLAVCGLLLCGVGVLLSAVVQFMAQQHLMTQLYRAYLLDGGEPVAGPDDEYDEQPLPAPPLRFGEGEPEVGHTRRFRSLFRLRRPGGSFRTHLMNPASSGAFRSSASVG